MFAPSNMLQRYLNARPRDMYDIVGALMGYINADPAFKTNDFDEAVEYVLAHGVSETELYDAFDPAHDLEEDESKWDEEYYSYARVYLKNNFCRKRIAHVQMVARKLYPASHAPASKTAGSMADREKTMEDTRKAAQTKGGQPEPGKKSYGQTSQNQTIMEQTFAKIAVGLIIICVVLALVIAFIIG